MLLARIELLTNFLSNEEWDRLRFEVQVDPLGLSCYGMFVINYNFAALVRISSVYCTYLEFSFNIC